MTPACLAGCPDQQAPVTSSACHFVGLMACHLGDAVGE